MYSDYMYSDYMYSDYFVYLNQEKDLNKKDLNNKIIYRKIGDSNADSVSILAFHTNLYDKFLNPIYFLYISKSEDSKEHFFLTLNEINNLSEYKNYMKDINIDNLKSIELDQLLFNYKNLSIDIQDIDTNEKELKKFIEDKIKNYIENNKNSKDKRKNNNERRDIYLGDILKHKWTVNHGEIRPKLQGWNHIIIDGIDNLPLELINTLINKKFYYIKNYDGIRMLILDKENEVQGLYDCIKCIIENSIIESINMVNTSKLLIPSIYHATKNEISYILPLYLQHGQQPDCVLLFNKTDNGYIGKTLLNMEEAQIDARVLGSIQLYSWLHF